AQRVVQRAFDAARARATLVERVDQGESANAPTQPNRTARVAQLRAGVAREEQGVAGLRERMRTAAPAARPALERQLAAATNRLDLGRARLDFLTKLGQVDSSTSEEDVDLAEQIRALQDAIPELSTTGTSTTVVTTSPPATALSSGARVLIYRLLTLQRNR